MTGIHAVHMLVGISTWSVVMTLIQVRRIDPSKSDAVEVAGPLLALRRHHLDLPLSAPLPGGARMTRREAWAFVWPEALIWAALMVLFLTSWWVAYDADRHLEDDREHDDLGRSRRCWS